MAAIIGFVREPKLTKHTGKISNLKTFRSQENFSSIDGASGVFNGDTIDLVIQLGGLDTHELGDFKAHRFGTEASHVSFNIAGKEFCGWLSCCPFHEGQDVEVISSLAGENKYLLYAIADAHNRIIAMYPSVVKPITTYFKFIFKIIIQLILLTAILIFGFVVLFKYLEHRETPLPTSVTFISSITWIVFFIFGIRFWLKKKIKLAVLFFLSPLILCFSKFSSLRDDPIFYGQIDHSSCVTGLYILLMFSIIYIFFGFIFLKQSYPFSILATQIFKCLGLENPENIDVVSISKKNPIETLENSNNFTSQENFGMNYFRY